MSITAPIRIARFYAVGAMGAAVQLGAVWVLVHELYLHYLLSTVLAVEVAIIHNFLWHDRWTWALARTPVSLCLRRFAIFNASVGAIALVANTLLTGALVEFGGLPSVVANSLVIAAASAITFGVSDHLVFRPALRARV